MFTKIQLYAVIGLLVTSIGLGVASWSLWSSNKNLKTKLEQSEITREKAQRNLRLVTVQLDRERRIREEAENALSELRGIPDVDYNTPLPNSVRDVLDRFHDRMRSE